jgi:hypothetical protein
MKENEIVGEEVENKATRPPQLIVKRIQGIYK